jgi:hypothetical protein
VLRAQQKRAQTWALGIGCCAAIASGASAPSPLNTLLYDHDIELTEDELIAKPFKLEFSPNVLVQLDTTQDPN